MKIEIPESFTITAHAGSLGTKANSYDSIKACLDFIGDSGCIEVDVRFNKRGVPVLCHNASEANASPVTLAELFALLKNCRTRVNLDMKRHSHMPEVQRLAEEYGVLPQLFFTGVKLRKARTVKKGAPLIPYYINRDFYGIKRPAKRLKRLAERIKRAGGIGLNTTHTNVDEKMLEIMRENGLLVSVFTVDKEAGMRRALYLGVDNITTRRPDALRELMAESNCDADNA